ncbi:MAG TPA: tetratricopeptide repeat protein [Sedimentisphaerales bacterium]|nr:tetratricopeptide repeat protein [Sedimentisphaerales bacterium]
MNGKKPEIIVVVFSVLCLLATARAQSVRTFVQQGNSLYTEGGFNEAIDRYDQALLEKPDVLEPKFNKANSYYRLDDLAAAIELYREVASESKDMKLVARARYNLGNCCFQQGLKQRDSNLEKALEALRTSIGHWRQVLDMEPENERAGKNIEVARLIIKDIIDQLNKQRQQQQQQAEKQKQLQEKLKELLEKQQALAQGTQATKDQADKGDISQQQAADNYAGQANEQSQLRQETERAAQELMQQQDPNTPPPPQMQQAAAELGQAAASQTNAQDQLKSADGAQAKQSEDKAAEHIENALDALSQGDQQGQQQQQQQTRDPNQAQEPNQPQQPEEQKTEAADATAQEILDKEQQEKKMRQMLQRSGYQKVDKDW